MQVLKFDQNRKREETPPTATDRVIQIIAQRHALTFPHAREVARLAGLGEREARP